MNFKHISLIFFLALVACQNEQNHNTTDIQSTVHRDSGVRQPEQNLNISFLLDLSDRIDPNKYPNDAMAYYKRDAAYIKSVAGAFRNHLNSKKIRQINEKIQVFFEPEPSNPEINEISEKLKFNFSRHNISKDLLETFDHNYRTYPTQIYNLAIEDNNYIGSDTWRFFKTNIQDYCVEEGYRNVLVIMTDGYIFHKDTKIKEENRTSYLTPEYIRSVGLNSNNWIDRYKENNFGYINLDKDLSNLEILVLGINPDPKNDYEEEVIRKYWSDWLENMNVKRFKIMNADLPSNMEEIIKDFI
ncbi:hypothetical protein MKO06_15645 [Gramella sp. GC03-9]|uniref:Uncharacterized protein n=1 Tax=Christiangramia oceanisediminis TaxID=2920386 RepID=A0A9X2KZQ9_9FLAO|nr:hypothetical protein [Gramella oceanisediminis]MCP9201343.1 hypothetical protein [Gramella oceanisediminis]